MELFLLVSGVPRADLENSEGACEDVELWITQGVELTPATEVAKFCVTAMVVGDGFDVIRGGPDGIASVTFEMSDASLLEYPELAESQLQVFRILRYPFDGEFEDPADRMMIPVLPPPRHRL